MQRYEEEDSDHSVNGWIKKEPDDEDDLDDEYPKHRQEGDPGDHYEDLIIMNKEDLVTKILQQEDDIRYMQDIRNGLEKTVQDLSSTVSELQTAIKELSSITSSLRDHQTSANVPASHESTSPVSSSTRSSECTKINEASSRTTPSSSSAVGSCSLASPKTVPASRNNTRLTESQTFSKSVIPSKERTSNTHSTVTIVKSTNVVIKTEIPSPPPEPEILDDPVQMSNYAKKRRLEPQQSFQLQPQIQNVQTRPSSQRVKQKSMSISQQQQLIQQQQQRQRMPAPRPANVRGSPSIQQNIQAQLQQQSIRMPNPRFPQNNPRMQVRGRGVQDFPGQIQKVPHPGGASMVGRPRLSNVKITPVSTTTAASNSPMTNVLAELGAKLPKSLSLSLVSPSGSASKSSDSSRSVTIKSTDTSDRPISSGVTVPSNSSKSSVGKVMASNTITSSASSSSDQSGKIMQFREDDDEDDENDYDEIAVLEPDKKNSRFIEEDGDKDPNHKKNRSSSELIPTNWSSQNNSEQNNRSGNVYHNNDEYMLDDAMDDTDLDESDPTAVYLGEDVTLSKDVLQNIIKEAMNHEQLIKNLMNVLFPDLPQLAMESNIEANKSYTALPSSKVNAIIELCRKRFPFKNKNDIFGVINAKFQEAKNMGRTSRSRMQYNKQY